MTLGKLPAILTLAGILEVTTGLWRASFGSFIDHSGSGCPFQVIYEAIDQLKQLLPFGESFVEHGEILFSLRLVLLDHLFD
jgi:hypothetical protein